MIKETKYKKDSLEQRELRWIAEKIFANGKITNVSHSSYKINKYTTPDEEWTYVLNGHVCYTIKNESFPVTYYIHMTGLEISEIIENIQL